MSTENKIKKTTNDKRKEISLNIEDIADDENYLVGLKKFLKHYWLVTWDKLNEDLNTKIEYTGVGGEAFVEMGQKIKRRFLNYPKVMVFGQDSQGQGIALNAESTLHSIVLEGSKYGYKFNQYCHEINGTGIVFIGSNSGLSIENIIGRNIKQLNNFLIYLSLSSYQPLKEITQYLAIIDKHEIENPQLTVVFIIEDIQLHDLKQLEKKITEICAYSINFIESNNNPMDVIEQLTKNSH